MKKLRYFFLSVAFAALCLCSLAGCGSRTGVYKFDSMTVEILGASSTLKAGENYLGVTLSSDILTVELKDDGTYVVTAGNNLFSSEAGHWTENADDSSKIDVTVGGSSTVLFCDGSELHMEQKGMKIILKK